MVPIDIDMLRGRIRDMNLTRGDAEQVELWRDDLAQARANLVIEDMTPTIEEDALFAMMLDEGVSPDDMVTVLDLIYQRGQSQIAA